MNDNLHKVYLGNSRSGYNSDICIVSMPGQFGELSSETGNKSFVYELYLDENCHHGSSNGGWGHKVLKIHGIMERIDTQLALSELESGIYTVNPQGYHEILALVNSDIDPMQKKEIEKFLIKQTGACPSCTYFLYEPDSIIHSNYTRK